MSLLKKSVRAVIGDINSERVKRLIAQASSGDWTGGIFRGEEMSTAASVQAVEYKVRGKDTFFGYYDKCPQSADGEKVLANVVNSRWAGYSNQPAMTVGYFDNDDKRRFHPVGATEAWCWQMGCMLTWLRQSASDKAIFNCLLRDRYAARIVNVNTAKIEGEVDWPIYCVSQSGEYALSCCFSRLHRLRRGYGYPQIQDPHATAEAPDDEGVWLLNLKSNTRQLLHSLRKLSEHEPRETMAGAIHYVNHLQFNQTDDRFLFSHIWLKGGEWYFRMFTSSRDGTDLFLLNDGYVSHHSWHSPQDVIVYSKGPDHTMSYHDFVDRVGLARPLFVEHALPNGHGTFCAEGDVLLTDTYPDRFGFQHLYLIHIDGALRDVGRFFHPAGLHMDRRCDLHPRWSRNEQEVFVDAAPDGCRRIVKLNVSRLREELGSHACL
jgi:hypothetical protein